MFGQSLDDLLGSASAQACLLGATPLVGVPPAALRSGRAQIFAYMVKVSEKISLAAKNLSRLEPDPLRSVTHRVDARIQTPARPLRAVAPAPAGLLHRAKGGAVNSGGTAFGLRSD